MGSNKNHTLWARWMRGKYRYIHFHKNGKPYAAHWQPIYTGSFGRVAKAMRTLMSCPGFRIVLRIWTTGEYDGVADYATVDITPHALTRILMMRESARIIRRNLAETFLHLSVFDGTPELGSRDKPLTYDLINAQELNPADVEANGDDIRTDGGELCVDETGFYWKIWFKHIACNAETERMLPEKCLTLMEKYRTKTILRQVVTKPENIITIKEADNGQEEKI